MAYCCAFSPALYAGGGAEQQGDWPGSVQWVVAVACDALVPLKGLAGSWEGGLGGHAALGLDGSVMCKARWGHGCSRLSHQGNGVAVNNPLGLRKLRAVPLSWLLCDE